MRSLIYFIINLLFKRRYCMGLGTGWKDAKDRAFKEVGKGAAKVADNIADIIEKKITPKSTLEKKKKLENLEKENKLSKEQEDLDRKIAEQEKIKEEREEKLAKETAQAKADAIAAIAKAADDELRQEQEKAATQAKADADAVQAKADAEAKAVDDALVKAAAESPCNILPLDGGCPEGTHLSGVCCIDENIIEL
jgi:hypothetical protein